jgi:CBS domain-containing protein
MTVAGLLEAKGRDVVTTSADVSLAEAIDALARHRIGALVVVDGAGRISGIISERDIVRALARAGAAALDEQVDAVMTRKVMTCVESETINDVMARMTRGRFRHLPVVDRDQLGGIVSIGDVVKARIEEVEREADDMRAYISAAV